MYNSDFSQRLKDLRVSKQLSRVRVAKELNIKYSTLANYENGIREPDYHMLKQLANYFVVSTDQLLGLVKEETYLPNKELKMQLMIKQLENLPEGDFELLYEINTYLVKLLKNK